MKGSIEHQIRRIDQWINNQERCSTTSRAIRIKERLYLHLK